MRYKCLNPDCRHAWDTRGDYAKILRCPSCRKGYVLDWDTFEGIVIAEAKWLMDPGPPNLVTAHLAGHATVVRKLFPMLPFDAFKVIDDEAEKLKREMQQAE
ncbi:hypothetical protein ES703_17397 [subsurface metagenome]